MNEQNKSCKMKKTNFLMTFMGVFFMIWNTHGQTPGYEISGKIEGADGISFYLQKTISGKIVNLDTAVVTNGLFKMTGGLVEYPEMVYLVTSDRKRRLSLFLENGKIIITGRLDSLSTAKVTGSKSNDEYYSYQRSLVTLSEKMKKIMEEYKAALEEIMAEEKSHTKDFIKNNPGSFVSPYLLSNLTRNISPGELESIINAMDPEVAKIPVMTEIKSSLTAMYSVAVGKKAPDFTLNDVNGKQVALSAKIGPKLLLIDFWAGWCSPCRLENPNVLRVYNDFHKKGFDIIGVSLDRTKGEWIKAIADDKLPWTQVSDLNYFNSVAAKLYNVKAIPANFLLDEKGIIIAVNLRGEALYKKVKEILEAR